jgi:hypothetical protein
MVEEEAIRRAKEHLAKNPFPVTGFRWRLGQGTRVPEGWYFDYEFEPTDGVADLPPVGGAPGFVVSDQGRVEDASWNYYSQVVRARTRA